MRNETEEEISIETIHVFAKVEQRNDGKERNSYSS